MLGLTQAEPDWRNWALMGAVELEKGTFTTSANQLGLSRETMDEMAYNDLFKIVRVRLNSDDVKEETELIELHIDDVFTFGLANRRTGRDSWPTSQRGDWLVARVTV